MFPSEGITGIVFADQASNNAVAGCEIGFIHSHTHKNGYGVRFQGDVFLRARSNNLTSEGCLGGVKVRGAVLGQLNKVNIRNQNFGDGSLPDFDLLTTDLLLISEYENRGASGNAGSTKLLVGNDKSQFGTITIHGGVPGHGVVFDTNVDHCIIGQLYVHDLRGNAQDGNPSRAVWTKSGTSNIYIGNIMATDNQVGWRNDSGGLTAIGLGEIRYTLTTYAGLVGLDFATQPSINGLHQCNFTTFDGTTNRTNKFSGSASVDPASTALQTINVPHTMWRTPLLSEVSASVTCNVGGSNIRPTMQYCEPQTPTSTNLPVVVKFSVAGDGNAAGSVLTARVA